MIDKYKVCLAQINPIVGDISGNLEIIEESRNVAIKNNADLLLTPELVVCGYPPEDLILRKSFISKLTNDVLKFIEQTRYALASKRRVA